MQQKGYFARDVDQDKAIARKKKEDICTFWILCIVASPGVITFFICLYAVGQVMRWW